jgi:7-keto-8-aminopelargonate synthetase-like enzyme
MMTNPTTSKVSYDDFVLGRCSIRGLLYKAFGVMGGYIAAEHRIIGVIRSSAPGFIYTTSPVLVAGTLAAVRHLKASNIEQEGAATLKALFAEAYLAVNRLVSPSSSSPFTRSPS